MKEIDLHVEQEVLNRVPAEFRPLLYLQHLTPWSLDREREHHTDLSQYQAVRATFQTALRSQHIDGDGRFAARWRSWKVDRHLKALVKASRKAAQAAGALRTSYADHVNEVSSLPGKRAQQAADKAAAKGARKGAVGALAAKSLHKTAATLAPPPGEDQAADGETAGQEPAPTVGGTPIRGVNDLFRKEA
ncbi:hypothetical protein [Streptomyces sp. NPDC045470]|uniref:hypothetical protein n=1 Tax=Streptomyces sp. NPDC045470 TaxID=3155469 RepID=UPI0033FF0EEE